MAAPFYKLLQEDYLEDPWRVLLACCLLNQTRAQQVYPVLEELLDEWPNAAAMADAPVDDIVAIIEPLGLKKRGGYISEMSRDYLEKRPKTWEDVLELTGCGRYAAECWRMLIQGERNFIPKDLRLRQRMLYWRMDECAVERDNQGNIALFLPRANKEVMIAIAPDQTSGGYWRDVHVISRADRLKHWKELAGYEPITVAERWLNDQSLVKLTPTAKEAIMLVIINAKGKFAGKFADDQREVAEKAMPEGSVIIESKEQLLEKYPDLKQLLAIYNSIIDKDNRIKNFADGIDAAGAADLVMTAAEEKAMKVKPAKPTREPGAKEKLRAALIAAGSTGLTMDEMAAVTGGSKKLVSDYMCYLKNPKYAGSAGPIEIHRMGDHYTVDKEAADAYATAEKEKAEKEKAEAEAKKQDANAGEKTE